MGALGLMKHPPARAQDHELSFSHAWIFNANALRLAVQHPNEFGHRPPQLIEIPEFVGRAACKR